MTDPSLPVVEPPFDASVDVDVSAVLLAAGTSSRFGAENKLLATVEGAPLVWHTARSLVAADLAEVVAVVGHEAPAVRDALDGLPVRTVENGAYAEGQATSVRRGVRAVSDDADGCLFALGDMPAVRPATVDVLVAAFAAGAGNPVVAAHEGQRGNPVLFGRDYFDRLERVTGDTGAREVLLSAPEAALVETGDPGVRRDVDRPGDLAELPGLDGARGDDPDG